MELEDTTIGWRFVNPAMAERYGTDSMGETAENVAQRHGVSREDQDAFALESHRRAVAAQEAGLFDDELVTVDAPQPKGDPITVHADEGPRSDSTAGAPGQAARRSSATGGTRHRGQLLADQRRRRLPGPGQRGAGRASWAASRWPGSWPPPPRAWSPRYMGVGPVPASRLALERAGLTIDDMELVELNEAFASQVLACQRELGIDLDRLNVNGGAIALGHPLGASGARLMGTLARELRRRGARYGAGHDVHRRGPGPGRGDREPGRP